MSHWPSAKAKNVLAALIKLGWQIKRQTGSHRTLSRKGWPVAQIPLRARGGNALALSPVSPAARTVPRG